MSDYEILVKELTNELFDKLGLFETVLNGLMFRAFMSFCVKNEYKMRQCTYEKEFIKNYLSKLRDLLTLLRNKALLNETLEKVRGTEAPQEVK